MREINIYEKGDEVYIKYEIDSLIFRNGTIYYKLKEPRNGTYLDNAYTADELISAPTTKNQNRKDETD